MKYWTIRTIDNLWKRHTPQGRAYVAELERNRKPINPSDVVKLIIQTIEQAGLRSAGTNIAGKLLMQTFVSQEKEILVFVHNDGDLYGVFQRINENNAIALAAKIANPPQHFQDGIERLNRFLIDVRNPVIKGTTIKKIADKEISAAIQSLRNVHN